MNNIFYNAKSFNQNLDLWNVGNVRLMDSPFDGSAMELSPPKWLKINTK